MLLFAVVWGSGACLSVNAATKRPFVLVIDAGHGGKDAGAVGQLTKEKDINLNVALALGRLVEQNCPDVKVIYTRKTDIFCHPSRTCRHCQPQQSGSLHLCAHQLFRPWGKLLRWGQRLTPWVCTAQRTISRWQSEKQCHHARKQLQTNLSQFRSSQVGELYYLRIYARSQYAAEC